MGLDRYPDGGVDLSWMRPAGIIGQAAQTSVLVRSDATMTDVPGLSIAQTFDGTRRVRAFFSIIHRNDTDGCGCQLELFDGATLIGHVNALVPSVTRDAGIAQEFVWVPTAGTRTVKVQARHHWGGSATFSFGQLILEDVGAAGTINAMLGVSPLATADMATALGALDPWHLIGAANEPAFEFGYSNYGADNSVAGFKKVNGIVYVKGLIKHGGTPATNDAFFTLPAGYRPALNYHTAQVSNNTFWAMRINGNSFNVPARSGKLEISGGSFSAAWADISCSFVAEA